MVKPWTETGESTEQPAVRAVLIRGRVREAVIHRQVGRKSWVVQRKLKCLMLVLVPPLWERSA